MAKTADRNHKEEKEEEEVEEKTSHKKINAPVGKSVVKSLELINKITAA